MGPGGAAVWGKTVYKKSRETVPLKGLLHEIFKVGFFHQTIPGGTIRGSLKPFSFLAIFHGDMQILIRLPGIQVTGSCNRNYESNLVLQYINYI